MGLPNIGPLELIIVLAIALLVVGPGKLPEMGSAFGRTMREFRKSAAGLTDITEPDKTETQAPVSQQGLAPNTVEATPQAPASDQPAATVASSTEATSTEASAAGASTETPDESD